MVSWSVKLVTDARKIKNRRALLDSAASAYAQNPRASLAEIAKAAGVGRATLHRHFPARNDLIVALVMHSIDETTKATAHLWQCKTAKDALYEMYKALVPLGDKYYLLSFEYMGLKDPDLEAAYKQQLKETKEMVGYLRRENLVSKDVPTSWAVALIDGFVYTAWAEVHAGHVSIDDAIDLAFRSALAGLGVQARQNA